MVTSDQIKALVQELGLTPYGISLAISAENDCTSAERKRIEKRWQRWMSGQGLKTLLDLKADLDLLGYEIVIKRKKRGS